MRKLTDYEKKLASLMLRTIGCTRDETAGLLKCRRETVADAEQQIRSCLLGEAVVFCNDQAMKRLANQTFTELSSTEEAMSPERLVWAAQLTGEDVLRHYRKDYPGKGVEHEEKRRLRALLQRWQEQLQSMSIGGLLDECCFRNWRTERERYVAEPEELRQEYLRTYKQHWPTTDVHVVLPVETEASFEHLKESSLYAQVSQAQESWNTAHDTLFDAFVSWFIEVEYFSRLLVGDAAEPGAGSELDKDARVANARRTIEVLGRESPDVWLVVRLLALTLACDLVVLGVQEQPPNEIWIPELRRIRKLRSAVVRESQKELPSDLWLTGGNKVHRLAKALWGSSTELKEMTTALLQTYETWQVARNNLHQKLRVLEQDSFGPVPASTTGRKT